MRIRITLGVCALAALAAPAAASAATDVSISASLKTLTVAATSNATNTVTIDADVAGDKILITDSGPGVATNDVPCTTAAGTISCPLSGLTKIDVNLNNLNDVVAITSRVPATIPTSLDGGSGNDALAGGRGADTLSGSSNNDFLTGGPGADTFRGGSGYDTASYAGRAGSVSVSIGGKSKLDGGAEDGSPGAADTVNSDIESLVGGEGGDYLVGDRHSNALYGNGGPDLLVGQTAGDYLAGGAGADFLIGNAGNDILDGGPGADGLRGNRDFDRLLAVDGERDASLNCGPGRDRVFKDAIDPRAHSCSHRKHRKHRRHHRRR